MAKSKQATSNYWRQRQGGGRVNPLTARTADVDPSTGLVFKTALKTGIEMGAGAMLMEASILSDLNEGTPLGADEVNAQLDEAGLSRDMFNLPDQVTQAYLSNRIKHKKVELKRGEIIAAGSNSVMGAVGVYGSIMMGTLTDPLELAATLFPIAGTARFATSIGRSISVAQRGVGLAQKAQRFRRAYNLFNRARKPIDLAKMTGMQRLRHDFVNGVVDGAIGNTLVEPALLAAADDHAIKYGLADSLMNVALGGIAGGGLSSGMGAMTRALGKLTNKVPLDAIITARTTGAAAVNEAKLPFDLRVTKSRKAVADGMNGRHVRMENMDRAAGLVVDDVNALRLVDDKGEFNYRTADQVESARTMLEDVPARKGPMAELAGDGRKTPLVETFSEWHYRTKQGAKPTGMQVGNARKAGYFVDDAEFKASTLEEYLDGVPAFRDADEALLAKTIDTMNEFYRPDARLTVFSDAAQVSDAVRGEFDPANLRSYNPEAEARAVELREKRVSDVTPEQIQAQADEMMAIAEEAGVARDEALLRQIDRRAINGDKGIEPLTDCLLKVGVA